MENSSETPQYISVCRRSNLLSAVCGVRQRGQYSGASADFRFLSQPTAINVQEFLNGPQYEQPYGAVGPVTISSDGFEGSTNYTSQDPALRYSEWTPFDNYSSVPLNGYEDHSTGQLNLSGLNSLGFDQSGSYGYYPIDGNRVLAIQQDDVGMGLLILEATSPTAAQN